MAKIIAIANQKGGVGKTTTCVNLAASLAAMQKRVLVVDSDPQGNATMASGINKFELLNSICQVLIGDVDIRDCLITETNGSFHLLPANEELTAAEVRLLEFSSREFRLKNALALIENDYDYVFIDCPPSLNLLTVNAMCAAHSIIVPLQCEYFALEGLTLLIDTVDQLAQAVNPDLKIEGILRTMFDNRNRLSSDVSEELKRNFGDLVYKTIIPRNVRLAEAPSFGKPAMYYDKASVGAKAYLALAGEIVEKDRLEAKALKAAKAKEARAAREAAKAAAALSEQQAAAYEQAYQEQDNAALSTQDVPNSDANSDLIASPEPTEALTQDSSLANAASAVDNSAENTVDTVESIENVEPVEADASPVEQDASYFNETIDSEDINAYTANVDIAKSINQEANDFALKKAEPDIAQAQIHSIIDTSYDSSAADIAISTAEGTKTADSADYFTASAAQDIGAADSVYSADPTDLADSFDNTETTPAYISETDTPTENEDAALEYATEPVADTVATHESEPSDLDISPVNFAGGDYTSATSESVEDESAAPESLSESNYVSEPDSETLPESEADSESLFNYNSDVAAESVESADDSFPTPAESDLDSYETDESTTYVAPVEPVELEFSTAEQQDIENTEETEDTLKLEDAVEPELDSASEFARESALDSALDPELEESELVAAQDDELVSAVEPVVSLESADLPPLESADSTDNEDEQDSEFSDNTIISFAGAKNHNFGESDYSSTFSSDYSLAHSADELSQDSTTQEETESSLETEDTEFTDNVTDVAAPSIDDTEVSSQDESQNEQVEPVAQDVTTYDSTETNYPADEYAHAYTAPIAQGESVDLVDPAQMEMQEAVPAESEFVTPVEPTYNPAGFAQSQAVMQDYAANLAAEMNITQDASSQSTSTSMQWAYPNSSSAETNSEYSFGHHDQGYTMSSDSHEHSLSTNSGFYTEISSPESLNSFSFDGSNVRATDLSLQQAVSASTDEDNPETTNDSSPASLRTNFES